MPTIKNRFKEKQTILIVQIIATQIYYDSIQNKYFEKYKLNGVLMNIKSNEIACISGFLRNLHMKRVTCLALNVLTND